MCDSLSAAQLIYTPHKMTPIHLVLVGFAPFNEGLFFFKYTFFWETHIFFKKSQIIKWTSDFFNTFWIGEGGFLLLTYYLLSKNQRSIFFINKIAFDCEGDTDKIKIEEFRTACPERKRFGIRD